MNKKEFFALFRQELSGLPKEDLDERAAFYDEIINDKMDEGKTEEEAIAELGSVKTIVDQIADETSLVKLVKEKYKLKRSLRGWEITMLILGFPLWFPIALVGLVLALVLYVVLWILVLVPGIASIASIGYGVICFIAMFANIASGDPYLLYLGVSIGSIGVGIMLIPAAIYSVKGFIKLTRLIFIRRKTKLIKREEK